MDKKEYALVLSGGGAKGSYEIGVWKALKELGIKINAVFGTSVGAINSAVIANNDFPSAYKLWKEISLDKIVEIPQELIKDGSFFLDINNLQALRKLQKNFFTHKGLNTVPLKNLINRAVNEEKIRKSGMDFGVVTYDISSYKPHTVYIEDIPSGLLTDYVVASSSIPVVFKPADINNKVFIDGGVHNNIPYDIAKNRGYKNIIVVDISGLGVEKEIDVTGTNTVYIKNSINMGSILDFSQEFINDYMQLGYLDTLRIFDRINGIKYFYKQEKKDIKRFDKIINNKNLILELKELFEIRTGEDFQIKQIIKNHLPDDLKNYKNYFYALSECAAVSLNLERIINYGSFKNFLSSIYDKYKKAEVVLSKKNYSLPDLFTKALKKDMWNSGIFKKSIFEYGHILMKITGFEKNRPITNFLDSVFPYFKAAKIFFVILKYYLKK